MKIFFYSLLFFLFFSCKKNTISDIKSDGNNFYDRAYINSEQQKTDSAYLNFYKAKEIFITQRDSLRTAKCLINMAIIENEKGDFFSSQETALSAMNYLNEKNKNNYDVISSYYNCLGIANKNLKNYSKSLEFYQKAIQFSSDSLDVIRQKNNLAISYKNLKNYEASLKIYRKILSTQEVKKDLSIYSKVIDNFAFVKFLQNPNYNAENELNKALEIRIKQKDFWGQNASHAHLSDYFKEKNPEKSLFHAKEMYKIASKLNSADDKLEALQKLIVLESPAHSKNHFEHFQNLNDSLLTERGQAKNQFALIRYETEKNKEENQKLKIQTTEKENKILKQNILLGVFSLFIILGYFWYLKRKKRLEQEKEIEIKNTEIKFSKKIHDVVANGLYQTMVEVENLQNIDKEKLLNNLEKMYEQSRDIAHEDISEISQKEFSEKLYEMISSYSSEKQKIFIVGNNKNTWNKIPTKSKDELYYVIREMMINMKKHSNAELISLKFELENKIFKIKYKDNGLGINDLENNKNSGIKNTENRIFSLGGDITFEKNLNNGLLINISIPI